MNPIESQQIFINITISLKQTIHPQKFPRHIPSHRLLSQGQVAEAPGDQGLPPARPFPVVGTAGGVGERGGNPWEKREKHGKSLENPGKNGKNPGWILRFFGKCSY